MLATIKALFRGRQSIVFNIRRVRPTTPVWARIRLQKRQVKALQELQESGKYGPSAPISNLAEAKYGPSQTKTTQ